MRGRVAVEPCAEIDPYDSLDVKLGDKQDAGQGCKGDEWAFLTAKVDSTPEKSPSGLDAAEDTEHRRTKPYISEEVVIGWDVASGCVAVFLLVKLLFTGDPVVATGTVLGLLNLIRVLVTYSEEIKERAKAWWQGHDVPAKFKQQTMQ